MSNVKTKTYHYSRWSINDCHPVLRVCSECVSKGRNTVGNIWKQQVEDVLL